MTILILYNIIRKRKITIYSSTKPQFYDLCYVLYFFKNAYSSITLKILNLHIKDPNIFAFYKYALQLCLHNCIPY